MPNKVKGGPKVATTTVAPIHFEDFSGDQFERLCFAYLLRRPDFIDVQWYGQLGSDKGRDIIATGVDGSTHVFPCANYGRLTKTKGESDIRKSAKGGRSNGAKLTILAGGRVSAQLRDSLEATGNSAGFSWTTVRSGPELEELIRRDAPDLIRRFVEGVSFPETSAELKQFAFASSSESDDAIVRSLAIAFDRPAFKTPFSRESSLPRFRAAIAETINTLNTGTTPNGKVFASKNDVRDATLRGRVETLVVALVQLRSNFDQLMRDGEIKPCGCGQEDCPTFMMTDRAVTAMDRERRKLLEQVHALHSGFDPELYPIL